MLGGTLQCFLDTNSFTRGAALAFYGTTSLIPVLIIVIAIAGFVFGEEAAQGAIVQELAKLIGSDSAFLVEGAIKSALSSGSNTLALVSGVILLVFLASGVFGELQAGLNAIWNVEPPPLSLSHLLRARAASLGLVIAFGFLLLISLVIDAGVSATSAYIDRYFSYGAMAITGLNTLISFVLTSILFAAMYKVLPDAKLDWRDVIVGAVVTALAFEVGKLLIGLYLGRSRVISSYGAAGALASILFWIYYSAQIFLLGASFTKASRAHSGSLWRGK